MVSGLVAMQRSYFAFALKPFKGGCAGTAEINRRVRTNGADDWPASVPPETVDIHWEQLDAEAGAAFDIDLTTRGYRVWFDGLLDTPLAVGDLLIVDSVTWQVKVQSQPGNNSPIDSVVCVVRNE